MSDYDFSGIFWSAAILALIIGTLTGFFLGVLFYLFVL